MAPCRRLTMFVGVVCWAACLAGCGSMRETLPGRSAMEQLLMSTAADRAVASMPVEDFRGKAVFIDATNLDAYDRPYVIQRIRYALFMAGSRLVAERSEADVVLEAASGGLSVNRRDYLLGIPGVVIPVPLSGGSLVTPELPIFKMILYRGKAKLLFCAVDPKSGEAAFELPFCYGKSMMNLWWFLIFGPQQWTDLPEGLR